MATKSNTATELRNKIFNNIAREAVIDVMGIKIKYKQPTHARLVELAKMGFDKRLNDDVFIMLMSCYDPDTDEQLFDYDDIDSMVNLSASFIISLATAQQEAFKVTTDDIEGN
ncbi:hypothetical protein ACEUA8_01450 [Aeromonas veronii]